AMEFGKKLSELRTLLGYTQKRLASSAEISTAHLSLIEHGKDLPSPDAANRCIAALGLDQKTRKQLLQALERDRKAASRQKKQVFYFGQVLKNILQDVGMTLTDLAGSIDRPFITVYSWAAGSLLPSAKALANELIPALKNAEASER